jgi:hypothetical protein
VANEDGGAWIDRLRGLFLGRAIFWLSTFLIFEEHVGVRKLVLSGYLCECKV